MKPYIHRNEQGGGGEAGGSPRCAGRDKTWYVLAYGLKPLQKRMFAPSIIWARPAFGAVGGVVQAGCAAAWALAGPGRAGIRTVNLSAYVHPSMWPACGGLGGGGVLGARWRVAELGSVLCAGACGGLGAAGLGVNNCVAGFQSVDSRGTITCFCGSCQAYFFGVNIHAVGASGGVIFRSLRNTFCAGCFLVGGGGLVAVLARAVPHSAGPVLVVDRLVFVLIRIYDLRTFAVVRIVRGGGGAVFLSSVRILSVMTCQGVRLGVFDSFLCMFYLLA